MSELRLLSDKVVLVTGAASGIGRAIALVAAEHGAKLVIAADLRREPREGGATVEELVTQAGAHCLFQKTDVRQKAEVERAVAAAEAHGGLDIMVCNAGIALPESFLETSEEDYRRLLAVNLDGTFFAAQAAAKQMVSGGKKGSIVMISSMGGLRGSAVTPVYSTTKGGVRLLAASMADALGPHGIRVNAVCPGVIDTQLVNSSPAVAAAVEPLRGRTPLRRLGRPNEVGEAVAWLGSDLASFVTGISLPVDGGLSSII